VLNLEPQAIEGAHVDVSGPNERKLGEDVATPSLIKQLELCKNKEGRRYVVAEAILTSEEIKELPKIYRSAIFAAIFTKLPRFAKYLFMGDGPGYTGYCKTEQQESAELMR
jgi:hypothetical protein